MGEGGDTRGLITAVLLLAAWPLCVALLYWRRIPAFIFAFACLGPLFLEFKHSFAREAGHIEIFFLFVPLLFGLVALFTRIRRRDVWYVAAACALVAAIWSWREFGRLRNLTPFSRIAALQDVIRTPNRAPQLDPDRLP